MFTYLIIFFILAELFLVWKTRKNKAKKPLLILNLISLVLLISLFYFTQREFLFNLDIKLNEISFNLAYKSIMIFLTNIMNTITVIIISIILLSFFIKKKYYQKARILFFSLIAGLFIKTIIKELVQRARPMNMLVQETEFSFPSGHALFAALLFTFIIFAFKDEIKSKIIKYSFIAANIVLMLLISFSRLYLKVHWFSDVLAGFLLGIFILAYVLILEKDFVLKQKN